MDDLISRQAAIDICENAIDLWRGQLGCGVMIAIKNRIVKLPSVERPTGRWIRTRMPVTGAIEHRCSRCDTPYYMAFAMEMNYCPNCGAKMEVGDGSEKQ